MPIKKNKLPIILLLLTLLVLFWSSIHPKDRMTWWLEVIPAIVGIGLMLLTYKKFRLTDLLYTLIMFHCMVLCVGGKYTYAEVPAGFWFQHLLNLSRNPWDRLGHLFQGFVPAILAREILLRKKVLPRGFWLNLFVVSVCLAFSAFYELIEWAIALISGQGATAFLGTQGDVWDTQWDMFCCLIGTLLSLITLSQWHNKQLQSKLTGSSKTNPN
jgi:putative membrane protein